MLVGIQIPYDESHFGYKYPCIMQHNDPYPKALILQNDSLISFKEVSLLKGRSLNESDFLCGKKRESQKSLGHSQRLVYSGELKSYLRPKTFRRKHKK